MLDTSALDNVIIVILACVLIAAIVNDIAALKIENRFCIAVTLLYPAHVLAAPFAIDWLGALAVSGIVFVVGIVLFAFRLVGGGDVKLMAALALWAGPAAILPFLLVTTVAGGALAVLMLLPVRFTLAAIFESVGAVPLRDRLLGCSIPYAIPIAAGALAAIGPVLAASPH